jgi:hypothetical protein
MPTHDSIQAITTAIADSSGLPGPASVVTTSCVVEDVQSTSSGCVDELLFWAKELSQWNAFGRKLFPDRVPCTMQRTTAIKDDQPTTCYHKKNLPPSSP